MVKSIVPLISKPTHLPSTLNLHPPPSPPTFQKLCQIPIHIHIRHHRLHPYAPYPYPPPHHYRLSYPSYPPSFALLIPNPIHIRVSRGGCGIPLKNCSPNPFSLNLQRVWNHKLPSKNITPSRNF